MNERVRAILITPAGTMLVIRRVRPGHPPYWVLPGGGVESGDASLEAALAREIWEEVAGVPEVAGLLTVLTSEWERSYYYLARIRQWSFADRTGPEFSEPGSGSYELQELPLTVAALDSVNLKPDDLAAWLRAILAGDGLFAQPFLR
jgi:8-oxo-dGTP pyrophosphatase MutT (NUDIX family)